VVVVEVLHLMFLLVVVVVEVHLVVEMVDTVVQVVMVMEMELAEEEDMDNLLDQYTMVEMDIMDL
jgi:hypothetical protein